MNLCRACNEDFGSVTPFDAHRVGRHDYTDSEGLRMEPMREDGRRCLDVEELTERGWRRDNYGRWRQPIDEDALLARAARADLWTAASERAMIGPCFGLAERSLERYGPAGPRAGASPSALGLLRCEEAIVVTTTLTMKMTEEQITRLDARLRHVIQFSEASKQAAEEALALLHAVVGVEEVAKERENGA